MLRRTGAIAVGLAGGTLFAGCSATTEPAAKPAASKAAPSTGPLTIATVGGTWKDWQDECVAASFTPETGVNVAWDVQTPVGIITAMVAAKKANQTPSHHISKMDQFDVAFVDEQGLTSKVDQDIVTNWKDIHPNFRTDSWMTNHVAIYGMTWNKDQIKSEVNSWFDMWDDKYKGKLAIPTFEWVGFHYLTALNTALGGTPENVEPAFSKLKELVDTLQPKFMNSVEHGNQLFESGEIWIAPFWDGRTRNLQDNNVPVSYKYPKEGALSNGSGFVINRDITQNVREANLFMNKVGDPESQICFASKINYPPTNVKAKLPPSLERIQVTKEDMDKMLQVPWTGYTPKKGDYLDRWNREIAKSG
jgi:putative spermidine/putrescine transport system substrate-binding protein